MEALKFFIPHSKVVITKYLSHQSGNSKNPACNISACKVNLNTLCRKKILNAYYILTTVINLWDVKIGTISISRSF